MRFSSILFGPMMVLYFTVQQNTDPTWQDVQDKVVRWFPLLTMIGLATISTALIFIALRLSEISKHNKTLQDSRKEDVLLLCKQLSDIKKALEEKRG